MKKYIVKTALFLGGCRPWAFLGMYGDAELGTGRTVVFCGQDALPVLGDVEQHCIGPDILDLCASDDG